jgi:hypothetical protein
LIVCGCTDEDDALRECVAVWELRHFAGRRRNVDVFFIGGDDKLEITEGGGATQISPFELDSISLSDGVQADELGSHSDTNGSAIVGTAVTATVPDPLVRLFLKLGVVASGAASSSYSTLNASFGGGNDAVGLAVPLAGLETGGGDWFGSRCVELDKLRECRLD